MEKNTKDILYFYVNHIVNITIVDSFLNKNIIRAKSPATYMSDFLDKNDDLKNTMMSHFIDIEKDGIWENDYNKFYDNRVKRITKELNKFIIEQNAPFDELEVYEDIEQIIEEEELFS